MPGLSRPFLTYKIELLFYFPLFHVLQTEDEHELRGKRYLKALKIVHRVKEVELFHPLHGFP